MGMSGGFATGKGGGFGIGIGGAFHRNTHEMLSGARGIICSSALKRLAGMLILEILLIYDLPSREIRKDFPSCKVSGETVSVYWNGMAIFPYTSTPGKPKRRSRALFMK